MYHNVAVLQAHSIKCDVLPSGGRPSGTELIPLFPYLRAGLLKKKGGAYRSPDEVSLDRRLKIAITCEFT